MADLIVDVDGLEALVGTIKRVQDGLNSTPDLVRSAAEAMGSGDVAGAMDHFQDHWHDGRKHISDNAETMTSMLGDSAAAYRKTDTQLASSVTENQSTTQIGHGA
jgi:hypothetical protein